MLIKKSFIFRTSSDCFALVEAFLLIIFISLAASVNAQQKVIQLYNGAAPGSENWTWDEKENNQNMFNKRVVYNVSHPSLIVFLPDTSIANGTSVIICPGGAWHMISIEDEGYEVARWLNKRGITAFILKYRLAHVLTDDPIKETIDKYPDNYHSDKLNEDNRAIVALAIADGKAAISYVRNHAAEYGISKDRIGIMGGSSGGTIAAAIAYEHTIENRPDFVAPLYPYVKNILKLTVPDDAPPMFIAGATDDQIGFNIDCIELYKEWVVSKHSAELHIYSKGGHGFGMNKQGLPSDTWVDRLADWLDVQGLLKPKQ
jgi:acetyl esterase/lipase